MGWGEVKEGKGGHLHDDERRRDSGWWAHHAIERSRMTELYT